MSKKNKKIFAMIPARIGSERLKYKNLAILKNKPLIYYAINSAKKSKIFDKIFLNSDNSLFKKISDKYNIQFYLRKKKYGSSNTKSDTVVNDFFSNHECDILVWVNPIAPLIQAHEISGAVKFFIQNNLNSLITVHKKFAHSLIGSKPINFKFNQVFAKTQDLKPITIMNYSIMMWKKESFIKSFSKNNHAILHGKKGFYEISDNSALIVKYAEDLELISKIMESSKKHKSKLRYDKIVNDI